MKNKSIKNIPSLDEAKRILAECEEINPGLWIGHSQHVALSAKFIAENCTDLDPERAYILGLLHDVGKTTPIGQTTVGHIMWGYDYFMDRGYDACARICVTHSCPSKSINDIFESKEENENEGHKFIENFLNTHEYDDYDRLIQLCDALGLHSGFILIEKRLLDVTLRHGVNDYLVPKWKAFMELKDYFDKKIGKSIYSVLPGVIENTFDL